MDNPMIINDLMDDASKALGVETDYKLAQVLEIPRQRISGIRAGSEKASPYVCTRLAQALKRDPLEIIAMVEGNSAKNEAQRAFWRSFKFCGTRNSLGLLLFGMLAFFGVGLTGGSAEAATAVSSHNVHYVK